MPQSPSVLLLDLLARTDRVCIALAGPEMLVQAEDAGGFVEFRLDSLANPSSLFSPAQGRPALLPDLLAIATCRRTGYGGGFHGSANEQLDVLRQAAQAGCRAVDIEVETAEELGPAALDSLRAAGAAVIVSWHDFNGTPDLAAVYQRLEEFKPDFIKIVPTAQTLTDSLRLVALLRQHSSSGRLVAMSMGQPGVLTRVLGLRYGSAFTFASQEGQAGTAPGQITGSALRNLYRVASITPQTAIYAVTGSPIGASLSPLMHNTAFRAQNMNAVYLSLQTADADELLQAVEQLGIRGLSVTMPLKEAVLPLLATRDKSVDSMRACNTLLRSADGTFFGFNTDVEGIVAPLRTELELQGKRVLVLGAGGAARAAVFGLLDYGAKVYIANRTATRAEALAQESGAEFITADRLTSMIFEVIINATPYGMRGKDLPPPIAPENFQCELFFDLVYNPVETPLMQLAKQRGIRSIPGAAMFVAQGIEQFRLWTGNDAPKLAMLQAVEHALSTA